MSLAFNLFFWDGWSGSSSASAAVVTIDTGAGSGGSKKQIDSSYWDHAHEDYWYERERYLQALLENTTQAIPKTSTGPTPEDTYKSTIAQLMERRAGLIHEIRQASTSSQLHSISLSLKKVQDEIAAVEQAHQRANLAAAIEVD